MPKTDKPRVEAVVFEDGRGYHSVLPKNRRPKKTVAPGLVVRETAPPVDEADPRFTAGPQRRYAVITSEAGAALERVRGEPEEFIRTRDEMGRTRTVPMASEETPPTISQVVSTTSQPMAPYPDPVPHDCPQMNEIFRRKIFDVAYRGPIVVAPLVANDRAVMRGAVSPESAEAARRGLIAVRRCPAHGTVMDPEVKPRPFGAEAGEAPCCCGAMGDLVRSGRVEIPRFATARVAARLLAPEGPAVLIVECLFCDANMLSLIVAREKHFLALGQ